MRNIRLKFFICGMLLTFFSVRADAQNNVVDEVIWVVGNEAILKSDVEMSRIEGMSQGVKWDGDPYCVIPEQLAIQKLFLHQAAIDSIEVSDADVMQNVERRISYYVQNIGSREKMEEYFGKTYTQIRDQLFEMVKNEEVVSEVKRSLVKNIKITPAQVRRFFKDMPEDSIPFVPTKYEVQILVRQPVIGQEEIDRVKDELRDYTERVNKGESQFSTLARLYSQDTGSAKDGGALGFIGRADVVPEFANVAFNLTDPKTVSKIFETEYGFHIMQLIEKRGDQVSVRHILRKPRVSDEEIEACVHFLDSVTDELSKKLYTFDECTPYLSQDKDTRNNYGIMVNSTDGTPKFELKDLPTEVAKVVANMSTGEISKPFVMVNKQGMEVVAMVRLRNKIEGHKATMADDYQLLNDVVMSKLSSNKIENWIREKQKTTYVRINDDWKNCEFTYPGWIKQGDKKADE